MSIFFLFQQNQSVVTMCEFSPDLRTVPGVLLPPPGVPGPPVPAFFVSRLLKKLANTPSLVWPAAYRDKSWKKTKNTHMHTHKAVTQSWVAVCSNYMLWRTRLWHGVCYVGRCGAITCPGGAGRCSAGGVLWTAAVYFTLEGGLLYLTSQNYIKKKGEKSTHHWPPCCHSGLFGEHRLQIRAQYAHSHQLAVN